MDLKGANNVTEGGVQYDGGGTTPVQNYSSLKWEVQGVRWRGKSNLGE